MGNNLPFFVPSKCGKAAVVSQPSINAFFSSLVWPKGSKLSFFKKKLSQAGGEKQHIFTANQSIFLPPLYLLIAGSWMTNSQQLPTKHVPQNCHPTFTYLAKKRYTVRTQARTFTSFHLSFPAKIIFLILIAQFEPFRLPPDRGQPGERPGEIWVRGWELQGDRVLLLGPAIRQGWVK